MIDSVTLAETYYHKVHMIDVNDNEVVGEVGLYESEWDSDDGMPCIGIDGIMYNADEIKSIEIID